MREGVSFIAAQGRTFQAEGPARAKAHWQEEDGVLEEQKRTL